jgi:hypothetical protein
MESKREVERKMVMVGFLKILTSNFRFSKEQVEKSLKRIQLTNTTFSKI